MTVTVRPSTSELGALAEVAVAKELMRAGFAVYLPFFGAHNRVDLVYETPDGVFRRVQCKSARLVNGAVMFYTRSHTGGVERGYLGEVDEFGVYCAANGNVYLVPVDDAPARLTHLRVEPTRNNQVRRTLQAEAYLLRPD